MRDILFDLLEQQTTLRGAWVASDVCAVLDLSNVSEALSDFEDYQKGISNVDTPGGVQKMLTVTEAGLYALVFKSRKDNAKRFQKWVIAEVLPAIRKHGYYAQSSGRHLPPALEEQGKIRNNRSWDGSSFSARRN